MYSLPPVSSLIVLCHAVCWLPMLACQIPLIRPGSAGHPQGVALIGVNLRPPQATRKGWPYYRRAARVPSQAVVSRRATPGGWPALSTCDGEPAYGNAGKTWPQRVILRCAQNPRGPSRPAGYRGFFAALSMTWHDRFFTLLTA